MPDYKEMYLTLFRATEQAINTLIAAQQQCEELYMNAPQGDCPFPKSGHRGNLKQRHGIFRAAASAF